MYLDGDLLTTLRESEVKKISIDSGSHLLEFKTSHETTTKIIQAVDGGNLVVFDEELRKKSGIDDPVTLFGSPEEKEQFIRDLQNIYKR